VTGIGASGGIGIGRAAFSSESAQRLSAAGEPVILLRPDTSTADVAGFALAAGIVTSVGARTSHAALVARQMGKPCVVGCRELNIDPAVKRAQLGNLTLDEGEWVTIEGDAGELYLGRCETIRTRPEAELAEIATWQAQSGQHGRHAAAP
jgi:pyruvate,orthophosphate dikinase